MRVNNFDFMGMVEMLKNTTKWIQTTKPWRLDGIHGHKVMNA
jgi:hypothetical protein